MRVSTPFCCVFPETSDPSGRLTIIFDCARLTPQTCVEDICLDNHTARCRDCGWIIVCVDVNQQRYIVDKQGAGINHWRAGIVDEDLFVRCIVVPGSVFGGKGNSVLTVSRTVVCKWNREAKNEVPLSIVVNSS